VASSHELGLVLQVVDTALRAVGVVREVAEGLMVELDEGVAAVGEDGVLGDELTGRSRARPGAGVRGSVTAATAAAS
jgi:hypothetical protein